MDEDTETSPAPGEPDQARPGRGLALLPPPPAPPSAESRTWTRSTSWSFAVLAALPWAASALFILSDALLHPRTVTETSWILLGPFALWFVPFIVFLLLATMCWPRRRFGLYIATLLVLGLGQLGLLALNQLLIFDRGLDEWMWVDREGQSWPDRADLLGTTIGLLPNILFVALAVLGWASIRSEDRR